MKNKNEISSRDLKVGEAMRVTEEKSYMFNRILLKTYDTLVDINSPNHTWVITPDFRGVRVKLEINVVDLTD
jgi:hypothetical protein